MEVLKDFPIESLKEWNKNPRKNDFAVEKLKTLIEKYFTSHIVNIKPF